MTTAEYPPYTALAEIYDQVMAHVDYEGWARYLVKLIRAQSPGNPSVLELGCGTGSLTVHLARELHGSYLASDNSTDMLSSARTKLVNLPHVGVELGDFRTLQHAQTFDLVILAYDGINYAKDVDELRNILSGVSRVMRSGGLFMFDESTPANSINNLSYFDDQLASDDISYTRTSNYDEQTQVHVTRFTIEKGDSVMVERHEQRAFTRIEMLEAIRLAHFEVVSMLEAFEFEPADDKTERIQWVLRKPTSTDNKTHA